MSHAVPNRVALSLSFDHPIGMFKLICQGSRGRCLSWRDQERQFWRIGKFRIANHEHFTYTTPDDQAKVAQFYKERYPDAKPMEMSFGGDQISVFTKEDAKTRMGITVVRKKGEAHTTIKILVGKQDEK